jgi:hypothetical protein
MHIKDNKNPNFLPPSNSICEILGNDLANNKVAVVATKLTTWEMVTI